MDNHQNAFLSWLQAQVSACQLEASALELDSRQDEAVFSKIRGNVFDIFRTVCAASPDPVFFLARLDQIPANWQRSLNLARLHGDEAKAHIETIKLEAAALIRQKFLSMQEDHT